MTIIIAMTKTLIPGRKSLRESRLVGCLFLLFGDSTVRVLDNLFVLRLYSPIVLDLRLLGFRNGTIASGRQE